MTSLLSWMHSIAHQVIGQKPRSGRDPGCDISPSEDTNRKRERDYWYAADCEREREGGVEDFLNPWSHLESICVSLAGGRIRPQRSHMWKSLRHMPHIWEREREKRYKRKGFTLFGIRQEWECTVTEKRWDFKSSFKSFSVHVHDDLRVPIALFWSFMVLCLYTKLVHLHRFVPMR